MNGRLLVLGGTGRTGRAIVEVALERGYTPVVFGRSADPQRVPAGAEAFPGDVLDEAAVEQALSGVDAVVTALSIPRRSRSPFSAVTGPTDLHSRSTALLIELLRSSDTPRRLVKLSAQGVGDSAPRAGWAFRALVQFSNLRPAFEDHARADALLREVPTHGDGALRWTIVRPPILAESDESHKSDESDDPVSLEASESATTTSFTRVPIGAVARWIVDSLDQDGTVGRVLTLRPAPS